MLPNTNYKKALSFEQRKSFYETQKKYNQWKTDLVERKDASAAEIHENPNGRETILEFIDFGIRRIFDVETRKQFLDYITSLNGQQLANLFQLLFGAPTKKMDIVEIMKKFAPPMKKTVSVNNVQPPKKLIVTGKMILQDVEAGDVNVTEETKGNNPPAVSVPTTTVLIDVELGGMPIEAQILGLLPEIFDPLDESQQKNIPSEISAPISLAMETFTHFQEWTCNKENKDALEKLTSQLSEGNIDKENKDALAKLTSQLSDGNIDFVFKRTETPISSVPSMTDNKKSSPKTRKKEVEKENHIELKVQDFLNKPLLSSERENDSDDEYGNIEIQNLEAPALNIETLRDYYKVNAAEKLSIDQQRGFLEWYDERMQKVFSYYENALSDKPKSANEKNVSDKTVFQNWRSHIYPTLLAKARKEFEEELHVMAFLTRMQKSVVGEVNYHLQEAYQCLDRRNEGDYYFHRNDKDSEEDLFAHYLNMKYLALKEKMLHMSPEECKKYLDTLEAILSAEDETKRRGWLEYFGNLAASPVWSFIETARILKDFVMGNPDSTIPEPKSKKTLEELLNEKVLTCYEITCSHDGRFCGSYWPSTEFSLKVVLPTKDFDGMSSEEFKQHIVNALPQKQKDQLKTNSELLKKQKEQLKTNSDLLQVEGTPGVDLSVYWNSQLLTVTRNDNIPRYQVLSDEAQELFVVCLERNEKALKNFIQKHGALTTLSYVLTAFSYVGEVAYIAADFILRSEAMKPLLTAFGLEWLLDNPIGVQAFNILSTVFVTIANITFDPKTTAEGLMKKLFINPRGMVRDDSPSFIWKFLCWMVCYDWAVADHKATELWNNLRMLAGYFYVLIGEKIIKKPLISLCFLLMAFGGAAVEILALQQCKEWFGMTDEQFNTFLPTAAIPLINSGILYYFFFNFDGIYANTGKGIKKFLEILQKAYEGTPGAGVVLALLTAAVIERCFRMAYGPFITAKALGLSSTIAAIWAVIVALGVLGTAPVTRILNTGNLYFNSKVSPEQYRESEVAYNKLSFWQKTGYVVTDATMPLIILLGGYTPGKILSWFIKDSTAALILPYMAATLGAAALYKGLESSIRQKAMTQLALNEKTSLSWVAWSGVTVAFMAVAFDNLSRAVGGETSLATLVPFLNNYTPLGSLLIVDAFAIMSFIAKTSFDLQYPSVSDTMKGYAEAISNGAAYCAEGISNRVAYSTDVICGESARDEICRVASQVKVTLFGQPVTFFGQRPFQGSALLTTNRSSHNVGGDKQSLRSNGFPMYEPLNARPADNHNSLSPDSDDDNEQEVTGCGEYLRKMLTFSPSW